MKKFTRLTALVVLAASNLLVAPGAYAADVPDPAPQAPAALENAVEKILGVIKYLGLAAMVGGLILIGIKMVSGKDSGRGGRDGMDSLYYWAGGMILIGATSSIVGFFM